MEKIALENNAQKISKILLVIIATISLILRIRKMLDLSMAGEEPSGFDWYMVCMWLVVMFFFTWDLLVKAGKAEQESQNPIKVSRKDYRDRQNQATGPLIVAVLAFAMLCYNGYLTFFEHKEPAWSDLIWLVVLLICVITWRIRERKLSELVIEDQVSNENQ